MKIQEVINQLNLLPKETRENVDIFLHDGEFDVYNEVKSWQVKNLFYVPSYYGNEIKNCDDVIGEDGVSFLGLVLDIE
jgi:hypothetical protein